MEPDPDTGALANGYETRYLYDARGNLLEVLQGVQVRAFEYDSLGRLTRQTHPESGTTWHFYDDNSNPTFRMDERGKIREQLYDELDRVVATHFYDITFRPDDTPWLDFFYDTAVNGVGRLASVDETRPSGDQTGESDYQHDVMGRVVRMDRRTLSHVFVSLYEYNFLGGVTRATYPQANNFVFEWTYDDQGRQTSVTGDGVTGAGSYSFVYNGLTALETTDFPQSNRQEKITYNERLQPVLRQVVDQGTGMEQMHLDYSFKRPGNHANNGNIWQIIDGLDPDKSVSYDYDFLNRITEAKHDQALHQGGPSWSIGYGYDSYGNRLSALTTLGSPPSFQDASTPADVQTNRLQGSKYDAAGNLVQDGSHTYQWDAEDRLVSVENDATAEYVYDYHGRRVAKLTSTEGRFYDWDLSGEVFWERRLNASEPDTVRAYLNGKLVCETKEGVGSHSIFSDHLGSSRIKLDLETGAKFSADFFYPFGQRFGPDNLSDSHSLAFTGRERDAETGLDYFGVRYFSTSKGRWMSPDSPLADQNARNPQSWNLYCYVLNNPLRNVDPDGKQTCAAIPRAPCGRIYDVTDEDRRDLAIGGMVAAGSAGVALFLPELSVASGLWSTARALGSALFGWGLRNPQKVQEVGSALAEIAAGVDTPGLTPAQIGAARVKQVAKIVGGEALEGIGKRGLSIILKNVGSTDVDVLGPAGELIAVGGPAKALNLAALGQKLMILAGVAKEKGVQAIAYFAEGTPEEVLKVARRQLGEENVRLFVDVVANK